MHFDDRLATVLRHRAAGARAARTQFRQLLDLLGARRGGFDPKQLASAWLRLGALSESIPARERATMVRDTGWRFRNPELAAHLAEDEPEVASAALARAELMEEDWAALIPRLPIRARGFLRLRRDMPPRAAELLERLGIHDRGLPQPDPAPIEEQAGDLAEPLEQLPDDSDNGSEEQSAISQLVQRIEAFQRARAAGPGREHSPRLPLGESSEPQNPPILGFAFTTDTEGRIDWAEPHVAPMIVGARLHGDRLRHAIAQRQPIVRTPCPLRGAEAVAGEWIVDAAPRFTTPGGRFYGFAGRFRRPGDASPARAPNRRAESEVDRIRQLLHELRTPVNAIQGFSEAIQQQVFGPVPHEYRALAANIAGDSARMLAGFDELDRLARFETGALELVEGECDFGLLCRALVRQLEQVLTPRMAGFEADISRTPVMVPISLREGEALAWRLLATIAASLGAGETAELALASEGGRMTLTCSVPTTLESEDDIFAATTRPAMGALSSGMFGAGFALRLARAEARAAGGELMYVDNTLNLTLPVLTAQKGDSSATGVRNST